MSVHLCVFCKTDRECNELLHAEVARMRKENARLRAMFGVEGPEHDAGILRAENEMMLDPLRVILEQLHSVHPLPRGKRLAGQIKKYANQSRHEDVPDRLWRNLVIRSSSLLWVAACPTEEQLLKYAAPLRKCREQRQMWREKAKWENRCAASSEVTT